MQTKNTKEITRLTIENEAVKNTLVGFVIKYNNGQPLAIRDMLIDVIAYADTLGEDYPPTVIVDKFIAKHNVNPNGNPNVQSPAVVAAEVMKTVAITESIKEAAASLNSTQDIPVVAPKKAPAKKGK